MDAAPRSYFALTIRWIAARLSLPSALITEQTLPSSPVLDRLGPDVHHLAAHEHLDPFRAIPGVKPQPIQIMRFLIDAKLCE